MRVTETSVNNISGAVIRLQPTSEVDFPSGTYRLRFWAIFSRSGHCQIRLYNATDAVAMAVSETGRQEDNSAGRAMAMVECIWEGDFAATKTVRLEGYAISTTIRHSNAPPSGQTDGADIMFLAEKL